jgi:hypothetical protein
VSASGSRQARQSSSRSPHHNVILLQLGKDRSVVFGIDHHADVLVILRRRPHHARSADVDILDNLVE